MSEKFNLFSCTYTDLLIIHVYILLLRNMLFVDTIFRQRIQNIEHIPEATTPQNDLTNKLFFFVALLHCGYKFY